MANKKLTATKKSRSRRSFYRIRRADSLKGYVTYVIAIPKEIGEVLHPFGYVYDFVLTDDGLLLRPREDNSAPEPFELPEWAR